MTEVKLFFDTDLMVNDSKEIIDTLRASLYRAVSRTIRPNVGSVEGGLSFQVRTQNSASCWFVGAFALQRALETYYMGLLIGELKFGSASSFLTMEREAQKVYTESNIRQRLEELMYQTPSEKLPTSLLMELDNGE